MTTATDLPVVDISPYGQGVDVDTSLAEKIHAAFMDKGFCYVSNHGIPQSQIDQMYAVSKTFFEKPDEYKKHYRRPETNGVIFHGWVGHEGENLNPVGPGDYKETFTFLPGEEMEAWPDVSDFEDNMKTFYDSCHDLSLKIMDLISIGLHLENPNFLRECHSLIGKKGSSTAMRCSYFPPIPPNKDIKPDQARSGEHSDYGCITLMIQNEAGGLEVLNRQGQYVAADPIPGTILINIGDLLQRWTSDKLTATKHRVLITEEAKPKCRQSVTYYLLPDNDVAIKCLDNSDKYKPTTSLDYLQEKFASMY